MKALLMQVSEIKLFGIEPGTDCKKTKGVFFGKLETFLQDRQLVFQCLVFETIVNSPWHLP